MIKEFVAVVYKFNVSGAPFFVYFELSNSKTEWVMWIEQAIENGKELYRANISNVPGYMPTLNIAFLVLQKIIKNE